MIDTILAIGEVEGVLAARVHGRRYVVCVHINRIVEEEHIHVLLRARKLVEVVKSDGAKVRVSFDKPGLESPKVVVLCGPCLLRLAGPVELGDVVLGAFDVR